MKFRFSLFLSAFSLLCLPALANAQAWSDIIPSGRAIDWSSSGIPGGIPARTTACATLNASTYGNGSSDASGAINNALKSCGSGQYVSLGSGTFRINSAVGVPSNVTLRGQGANNTIITCYVTTASCIYGGQNSGGSSDGPPSPSNAANITSGLTIGSTSITVSKTSGMSVGGYLVISQLNDPSFVSNSASANNGGALCACDGGIGWGGTRNQGQIVEITSISGNTVGITSGGAGASSNPGLYYGYDRSPLAVPLNASAKYAGIEALQVYAENTGAQENFYFGSCMYCWADGVESNYTDGNWAEIDWGFHDQISNSYMSNAFSHTSGTNDANVTVRTFSSGFLIQNNILERGHFPLMLEWGAAGGVVSYNYIFGQYDIIDFQSGGTSVVDPCSTVNTPCSNTPAFNTHGAHPQFILVEGNTGNMFEPDNIWGSSSWLTTYRNWWQGTTKMCANGNPAGLGRGTVSCSTGKYAWQIANAYEIQATSTNNNLIADVVGSTAQQSLISTQGGSALGQTFQTTAQCGPSPCGSGSRNYGSHAIAFSFGYFSVASTGGGAHDTLAPYNTALIHGVYTNMNGATTWASGVTHTLPDSLYLNSKPSWFGSASFPSAGPDTSGGVGPGGFASKIPAQVCYESIGGTDGTGSPRSGFNASSCYGSSSGSTGGPTGPTSPSAPTPPTKLTVTVTTNP
jgi:hypothetical protein